MKRTAVIGCGAIADSFHLPALVQVLRGAEDVILVDPDEERAVALARKHGLRRTTTSHREVLSELDAAIIASPHHTHVPIATELVEAGVPVLCEKPLGTTVEEVEGLRDLADARGVTVAVNQTRRFIPAVQEIRRVLESGRLGGPLTVDANEGDRFDWPAATPSMFGARSEGRGLLLDIGAHVLDLMVTWFGPDLRVEEYLDDSFGGSEASVLVALSGERVSIRVRLSWLAKQRNEYTVRGPGGGLRWGVYDLDSVVLEDAKGGATTRRVPAPRSYAELAPLVLEDFFRAAAGTAKPMAGPDDVLPAMRIMEACYESRARFDMPWHRFNLEGSGGGA